MNQGYIQQIGTPEDIYNEPQNAFVADFIGDSNILGGIMIQDKLVEILGTRFDCVDSGFGSNNPVDVVIRPEDVKLFSIPDNESPGGAEYEDAAARAAKLNPGRLEGVVTHLIFKGVHYEMTVEAAGFEWLVHSTRMFPVGGRVFMTMDPFNIQIMNKPESDDEKALEFETI